MNTAEAIKKLDAILYGNPDALVKKQQDIFLDETAATGNNYILFGSGYLGRTALAGFRRAGIEPIAFTNNDSRTWNTKIQGLRVISPEEAVQQYKGKAAFVVRIYTNEPVHKQLREMGIAPVSYPRIAWSYPNAMLPDFSLELPNKIFSQAEQVRKALELAGDDASRAEYIGQIEWRTTLNSQVLPPYVPNKEIYYGPNIYQLSYDEVFVDCGAFDGDSIRTFIQRRNDVFKAIIGVEADPGNFARLKDYVSTLSEDMREKIWVLQNAVGTLRETAFFDASGTLDSAFGSGSFQVEVIPLDEAFSDLVPTLIKMDIEGAELDALKGAENIIKQHAPVLAICAYHRQEDIWKIPLYLHGIQPQYKFFFRRYSTDCWEQVCYAVPKNRLV